MVIDDFITGLHTVTLAAGGNANYQSITTNPDFPVRSTWFLLPVHRPTSPARLMSAVRSG